jgi:hypothetical protein
MKSSTTSIANHTNKALKAYICFYNSVLGVGWLYVWFVIWTKIIQQVNLHTRVKHHETLFPFVLLEILRSVFYNLFSELKYVILTLEMILLLDTLHGALGFWGPDTVAPLWKRWYCKVGRRAHLLLFALIVTPKHSIEHSTWLGCVLFTWTLTDIIRYPYYALNMYRVCPYWLTWLRYTSFLIQYPLNVIAETGYGIFVLFPACSQPGALFRLELSSVLIIHYGYVFLGRRFYDTYLFPPSFMTLYHAMKTRLYNKKSV